jgi:hypothetical protein
MIVYPYIKVKFIDKFKKIISKRQMYFMLKLFDLLELVKKEPLCR